MKRLMATMMVAGITLTGFGGVAVAAEPKAEAKVGWSEGTQAKIDEARGNREANHSLREQIKAQHAKVRDLIGDKKAGLHHELKESLAQRREATEAKREAGQAIRDQMAEVKAALQDAVKAQEPEKVQELKAELESLRRTAQAEFGDWKAETAALKAQLEALKADRGAAAAVREELKPLFEQAKAVHQELEALHADVQPVRAAIQTARESQDDAALSAALDDLLPLQEERHALLDDLSDLLGEMIEVLQ